jgi:hypothetical protein
MKSRKIKKSRKTPYYNVVGISNCPYYIKASKFVLNNNPNNKIIGFTSSYDYKEWLSSNKNKFGRKAKEWKTSPFIWLENTDGTKTFIGGWDELNSENKTNNFSFNSKLLKYYLKGNRICKFGDGSLNKLAKIIKGFEKNRSWTSALHYVQTPEIVSSEQSYMNVAMPSGNSEYYIMIVCENESVDIEIDLDKKNELDQLISHNVAIYNGNGVLWTRENSDKNSNVELYDIDDKEIVFGINDYPELLYKKKSKTLINKMTVKGPALVISRFYKPSALLGTWILNLGLLPKVTKNGKIYKPSDLESIKKLSSILEIEFAKRIGEVITKNIGVLSPKRLIQDRDNEENKWRGIKSDNFFIPMDSTTDGLLPNIHSIYSFYNLPKDIYFIIIKISFPKCPAIKNKGIKIIYSDLMICDSQKTSTEFTISSDNSSKCEYIVALRDGMPLPENVGINIKDINSGRIHIARWRKHVRIPMLVYRILYEDCPNVISKTPVNFPINKVEQRASYLLSKDLTKPSIVKFIK